MEIQETHVGDEIRIGQAIGDLDGHLMGRLVGIRKDDCRPMERYIYRLYQPEDGWYPTGEYRTSWLLMPCTNPEQRSSLARYR